MEIQKRILSAMKTAKLKYSKIDFEHFTKTQIADNVLYTYKMVIPEAEFIARDDRQNKYFVIDKLVKEGEYWIVYRESGIWGQCPIFRTKDKKQAEILIRK